MPPLPVTGGAVVEVARPPRSHRFPEEAGDGGKLPGHGPQQGRSAGHVRSLGVRASIIHPLQPTDQPAQDGANVRSLNRPSPRLSRSLTEQS